MRLETARHPLSSDRAPLEAGTAVFVGATRYTGPLAWLRLAPRWFAMVRTMRRMPGYVGHGVYYDWPFTLGTMGFFATREDMLGFARTGEHRAVMQWVVGGAEPGSRTNATGGYIRIYDAEPDA
ncbi:MAG: DUF4188 domain-containing protein [Actinomycetes bacterium]